LEGKSTNMVPSSHHLPYFPPVLQDGGTPGRGPGEATARPPTAVSLPRQARRPRPCPRSPQPRPGPAGPALARTRRAAIRARRRQPRRPTGPARDQHPRAAPAAPLVTRWPAGAGRPGRVPRPLLRRLRRLHGGRAPIPPQRLHRRVDLDPNGVSRNPPSSAPRKPNEYHSRPRFKPPESYFRTES
jgi:hypothetical protein